MKKQIAYLLGTLACLALAACSDKNDELRPNTPTGNVDALWEIIDTKYCYLNEKGIDWQAIGDVYHTKAQALATNDERGLFDLMASMLDSLRDGHVNLYSSFDVSRNRAWYEGYPSNYDADIVYGDRYLDNNYKIAGGLYYQLIADSTVGYVRYESFANGFGGANMAYILRYFSKCKGLVVDVRNNGGGSLIYSYSLASVFFRDQTTIGYMQHKTGSGHNDFSALEPMQINPADISSKWLRPVVVLTNRRSYSATNHFANAMRYAPYAKLMGGVTGGGGGMPLSYELPNGWMVRFSAVPMYDADKLSIENGITPDTIVNTTAAQAAIGCDDLIEAAIKYIQQVGQETHEP